MRLLLYLFCLPLLILAQYNPSAELVLFESPTSETIQSLHQLGIATDHAFRRGDEAFYLELSSDEVAAITDGVLQFEIADKRAFRSDYMDRLVASNCNQGNDLDDIEVPENFTLGSMDGFYTLQELENILDSMYALYPDLISEKAPLPTTDSGISQTVEGRSIWYTTLTNTQSTNTNKPEVLYTSIHHAREPLSMTQNIFFMWHMLENYGEDPWVTYLLDNVELVVIPCINPDGYYHNETTNPNGGGFWRKNRVPNAGGSFGVDLNRNYSFQWGYDNTGSSPDHFSATYRGPSPASEHETQLMQHFVNEHSFQFAFNCHTFGDLLIYPWGYSDTPTPDSVYYREMGHHLSHLNDFTVGTGTETVGYVVNGDSDDWFYGDTTERDAVFSFTPEVGYSFWPNQDDIVPLCKSMLLPNKWLASYTTNYAPATVENAFLAESSELIVPFSVTGLGNMDTGSCVSVRLLSNSPNVTVSPDSICLEVGVLETKQDSFTVTFSSPISFEAYQYELELEVNNAFFSEAYPLHIKHFVPDTVIGFVEEYTENFDALSDPLSDFVLENDVDLNSSVLSSEIGQYGSNESKEYVILEKFEGSDYDNVTGYVLFDLNFDFEKDYDYGFLRFKGLATSATFCGLYTTELPNGEFGYTGTSNGWVSEIVEITDEFYRNGYFELVAAIETDDFISANGLKIDNVRLVFFVDPRADLTENNQNTSWILEQNETYILLDSQEKNATYRLIDMYGREVFKTQSSMLPIHQFSRGVYTIERTVEGYQDFNKVLL